MLFVCASFSWVLWFPPIVQSHCTTVKLITLWGGCTFGGPSIYI